MIRKLRMRIGIGLAVTLASVAVLALGPTGTSAAPSEHAVVHSAGYGATRAGSIGSAKGKDKYETVTVDRFVPHVSTVPANAGELVHLFVREVRLAKADPQPDHGQDQDHATRTKPKHLRRVVLMAGGATQPAMASFNLAFEDYNWMENLANAGFDVFALDVTGYGFSPRPTMDDPCNVSATEQALLIPNPLAAPCSPSYRFRLTSRETDRAEIDTVVDYIRNLRGVDTVDLIGWSRGGARMARYAALHPEKVGRLFVYAADYNRAEATLASLPAAGVPMTVRTISSFFTGWDAQATCPNEVDPAIRAPLASTIMSFDPVGQTWGRELLWRAPTQTLTGWNQAVVARITAPTLIIGGELDTTVPPATLRSLYGDLVVSEKVLVHVACAAHQMVWEKQHTVLQQASLEWLSEGTFAGQTSGVFGVDTEGVATRDP